MRPNQDVATIKEFKEAFADGHLELAWRIYRANPDLRARFDEWIGDGYPGWVYGKD